MKKYKHMKILMLLQVIMTRSNSTYNGDIIQQSSSLDPDWTQLRFLLNTNKILSEDSDSATKQQLSEFNSYSEKPRNCPSQGNPLEPWHYKTRRHYKNFQNSSRCLEFEKKKYGHRSKISTVHHLLKDSTREIQMTHDDRSHQWSVCTTSLIPRILKAHNGHNYGIKCCRSIESVSPIRIFHISHSQMRGHWFPSLCHR